MRTVAQIGNDMEHLERGSKLSETFLLGNLSGLLYELKYLAKATAAARSTRIKKDSIAKLKLILGRYRTVLESQDNRRFIAEVKDKKVHGHLIQRFIESMDLAQAGRELNNMQPRQCRTCPRHY